MIWPRECFTTEMKSARHRGAEKKGEKERERVWRKEREVRAGHSISQCLREAEAQESS